MAFRLGDQFSKRRAEVYGVVQAAIQVLREEMIGVVDGEARGPKIRVFKKKRRKGFRKTRGHRSIFTRVRITDIRL